MRPDRCRARAARGAARRSGPRLHDELRAVLAGRLPREARRARPRDAAAADDRAALRLRRGRARHRPGRSTCTCRRCCRRTTPAPRAETIDPEKRLAGIYFTGGRPGGRRGVMLSQRSFVFTYYMELLNSKSAGTRLSCSRRRSPCPAGCLLLPVLLRQGRCMILDRSNPTSCSARWTRARDGDAAGADDDLHPAR